MPEQRLIELDDIRTAILLGILIGKGMDIAVDEITSSMVREYKNSIEKIADLLWKDLHSWSSR